MNGVGQRVRRQWRAGPRAALGKSLRYGARSLGRYRARMRDLRHCTFGNEYPQGKWFLHENFPRASLAEQPPAWLPQVSRWHSDHRFDLLGSGWQVVRHGMNCRGLEGCSYSAGPVVAVDPAGAWLAGRINPANLAEAQRIWSLVDREYIPIDWQLDLKSGYRWSEATWHHDIPLGHRRGADIKAPWELARMQHLWTLACAHDFATQGSPGLLAPEVYRREFRNQVLDFIATNPPRFGANWRCPMDVAIRVANWLLAYDYFHAQGVAWDQPFEREFGRSVVEHGRHLVGHLEWSAECRENHYLADIAGLLFVAAYLPRTAETDAWLAFAVHELIAEVGQQFNPDGSNFEGSTSYHRLSAEMAAYATALVLGLPEEKRAALDEYDLSPELPRLRPAPLPLYRLKDCAGDELMMPFPDWYFQRLERTAEFTVHITKPIGQVSQIGDCDNGRWFKIEPQYRQMTVEQAKSRYANMADYAALANDAIYWDEDHLDHRHLAAAIGALLDRADLRQFASPLSSDAALVECLARGFRLPADCGRAPESAAAMGPDIGQSRGTDSDWRDWMARLQELPVCLPQQLELPMCDTPLSAGMRLFVYADFGLYVYRSPRLYLAIRCGPACQRSFAHVHHDQLSLELAIDGQDWLVDPGTYVYTPLPERRNAYRSAAAHFGPIPHVGWEPRRMDAEVFAIDPLPTAEVLHADATRFLAAYRLSGCTMYRRIEIHAHGLCVTDFADRPVAMRVPDLFSADATSPAKLPVSPGYGACHA